MQGEVYERCDHRICGYGSKKLIRLGREAAEDSREQTSLVASLINTNVKFVGQETYEYKQGVDLLVPASHSFITICLHSVGSLRPCSFPLFVGVLLFAFLPALLERMKFQDLFFYLRGLGDHLSSRYCPGQH